MYSRTTCMLLVCLLFILATFATNAPAWNLAQAAFVEPKQEQAAPAASQPMVKGKPIIKVKPAPKIVKCRPPDAGYGPDIALGMPPSCILPFERPQGWSVSAEAMYARTKGKVRFSQGVYGTYNTYEDVDLNSDLGVPDHNVMGTFAARYRFSPAWSVRYSLMPMVIESSGTASRNFTFGNVNLVAYGQATKVKWERFYHRIGLVYDPIRTMSSRVSVFGDFVKLDDRIQFTQVGFASSTMDTNFNMGMAGVEMERCLKTTASCSTLSLECSAAVAFGDDGVGSDMSTGIKFSIPLNNGRWGFVKGGYRYLTYKKKYSDAKLIDTCVDGGFVQMGLVF
jgi:hypothetical protein